MSKEAFLNVLYSSRTIQQFLVLYKKNALVAYRNWRATFIRVIGSLFFLILALVIDKAITSNSRTSEFYENRFVPKLLEIPPIPSCHSDLYIGNKKPCIELLYSPNNTLANELMQTVVASNSIPIAAMGFASKSDVNRFLLDKPEYALAAVHFAFKDAPLNTVFDGFVLQTNTTTKYFKGQYQDPNLFAQLPVQTAVQHALADYVISAQSESASSASSWKIRLANFPHPLLTSTSVLGAVLGPFVFAACMFSFVSQISVIVQEKESGLTRALRTMGMSDAAYWSSWMAWEVTLCFVISHAICIFGLILQFRLFLKNNYGLLFFLFFLFQMAMTSFAQALSTLVRRTQVAIYLGFGLFIVGWIMQVVVAFGVPYTPKHYKTAGSALTIIFSIFPWTLLSKGFADLGSATASSSYPGLRWEERFSYCQDISVTSLQPTYDPTREYRDYSCVVPLGKLYQIFVALWAGFFALGLYLDNVVPDEYGVSRSLWFFLQPSYWLPHRSGGNRLHDLGVLEAPGGGPTDPDVQQEEEAVRALLQHRTSHPGALATKGASPRAAREAAAVAEGKDLTAKGSIPVVDSGNGSNGNNDKAAPSVVRGVSPSQVPISTGDFGVFSGNNAVELFGLQKMYRGQLGGTGDCCSCLCFWRKKRDRKNSSGYSVSDGQRGGCCTRSPDFWAIKGTWLSLREGELFCLLGPNGAGKTTTINCLTGAVLPTAGEALVYGESISSPGGMNRIRSVMGVCPQFDVLWPELTAREHLHIYGHIKGMHWEQVNAESANLLERVKLTSAADQRTAAYSGGMKRRLSVAMALLGNPRIIFLDEPTTGMDPVSRRYVWDIIQEVKHTRTVILTTHNMEEADILGDKIAIMARGRLRCLGTSLRLKQRFGAGYQLSISVMPPVKVTDPAERAAAEAELQQIPARTEAVKAFVRTHLDGLEPISESRAYIDYLVDRDYLEVAAAGGESRMLQLLRKLEEHRAALSVTDIQVKLASLEEVFLTIARRAEIDEAMITGNAYVEHTTSEGTKLKVPVGADEVTCETTGVVYKVKWDTDDNGRLVILDCLPTVTASPVIVVPPTGYAMAESVNNSPSRSAVDIAAAGAAGRLRPLGDGIPVAKLVMGTTFSHLVAGSEDPKSSAATPSNEDTLPPGCAP